VLHGLRERYPQAQIDWLVGTAFAPLIEQHPDLSSIIAFDRKRYGRMLTHPSALRGFLAFSADLRQRKYDLVIDLQGLFRSGFLARMTGAAVRIGFAQAREFAWVFYTHRLRPGDGSIHAVDRNYSVAQMLGFGEVPKVFDLAITDPERQRAREILAGVDVSPGGAFAAILPGARWDTKRWLPERFAEVADDLAERGVRVVLLASRDEAGTCQEVARACSHAPANLAGATTLRELVAILEQAAVVICHDSAPMHIAAALGRPTVCILGPTDPKRTGPHGARATVLQADWPCVPCLLRSLSRCRFEHRCMTSIQAQQVRDEALAFLDG
jgi:lipopolysaccharide heptosyltransferase I